MVAGNQALFDSLGLDAVIDALQPTIGDGPIEGVKFGRVEQRQRLLGGRATQDVEQLAVHGVVESAGRCV